jgi:lipopolysaccharide export system protein LptC
VPIAPDNVAAVKASHGTYDRDGNTMNLTSDVMITTTDGMQASFKSVFLDMGKGTMKTDNPVDVSRGGSRIRADSMSVRDNGKILVFENKVRVNIDSSVLKTADGNSGETNVAQ